jgi:hypothetical protein
VADADAAFDPDELYEELLPAGAELVWCAGLRVRRRARHLSRHLRDRLRTARCVRANTGRALARAHPPLTMHALAQAALMPGRYSLFTRGVDTALFAACLDGDARYPVLELR